jgi:hypothetical protein
MGEFMLAMAQERAQESGVVAEILVRRGVFDHVLRDVIGEYSVQALVLGSAHLEPGVVTEEYVHELCDHLAKETGIVVFMVRNGALVLRSDISSSTEDSQSTGK